MKAKVIELLNNHIIPYDGNFECDCDTPTLATEIDTLYKADLEKRVAFEVACNPDLIEAQTNYKLYEDQINKLKEIIKKQDELIEWFDSDKTSGDAKIRLKIAKLKKEAGI